MTRRTRDMIAVFGAVFLLFGAGCSDNDDNNGGDDGGVDGDGEVPGDGRIFDGAPLPDADPNCNQATCQMHLLACGDCIDNDGDGLVDSADPECLGACDNTEGPELNTGVGGELGGPACLVDCYWDYGNGSGNDDCYWDHQCDPLAVGPDYPPEGVECDYDQALVGGASCPADQSAECLDFCLPLTPNGCDCFGCCTFPELEGLGPNGEDAYIWIGNFDESLVGTCTLAELTDPHECPPCTPVVDCVNPCGICEICVGKTEITEWCDNEDRCPEGIQWCGLPGDLPCEIGFYCVTGCCIPVPG